MEYLKKISLILLIFLSTAATSFCQNNESFTYLIVRLGESRNVPNKNNYTVIYAERTNTYAQKIYDLVWYDGRKDGINNGSAFYSDHLDSAKKMYNYFENSTEALQFLADDKWVLVAVNNSISSSYNQEKDGLGNFTPVSTISSTPVYYFKKQVPSK